MIEGNRDNRAEAEQVDDYVAWCTYTYNSEGGIQTIVTCDSDTKGAFKVYRKPVQAEVGNQNQAELGDAAKNQVAANTVKKDIYFKVAPVWERRRDNFRSLGNEEWRGQYAADIDTLLGIIELLTTKATSDLPAWQPTWLPLPDPPLTQPPATASAQTSSPVRDESSGQPCADCVKAEKLAWARFSNAGSARGTMSGTAYLKCEAHRLPESSTSSVASDEGEGRQREIEERLEQVALDGLCNLYHAITGKTCQKFNSLGMATSAVSALINERNGLLAANEQLRGEVEVERALKWQHFENAAKFDEEVRELKKLLGACEQKTQDAAIEVLLTEIKRQAGFGMWPGVEDFKSALEAARQQEEWK